MTEKKEVAEEAARAKRAAVWADALRQAKEDRPMRLEMLAYTCQEWFDRFQALKKVGFTPEQALQLCWRSA